MNLNDALIQISEKLGVAAEQVGIVLSNQTKVALCKDIIILSGLIILGIIVVRAIKKSYKKYVLYRDSDEYTYEDLEGAQTGLVAFSIIGVILALVSIFVIPNIISEIIQIVLNPPIWILEYLVELIG